MNKKLITIIIPVYNEEKSIAEIHSRVSAVMDQKQNYDFNALFIDNASADSSGKLCKEIAQKDNRWKYIRFSRNFGIEASFFAGANHAQGDALIYLFSDLQDPPEKIPELIAEWEKGYHVVYGVLDNREDSNWAKSLGAWAAYKLIYWLSDVTIPVNATDFRLLSRPVIDSMKNCRERTRYMRGISHWVGFSSVGVPFKRLPRKFGRSSAGFWWCIAYALNAIISFSVKPLRMASVFGGVVTVLSVLGALIFLGNLLLALFDLNPLPKPPLGWTTITLLLFFFGGLNSLFLGILGEYISQIQAESKGRPLYVISEQVD